METNGIQIEWVPLASLFENPANPRINDPAVPHVAASIRRFGWRQPIVAKPSGEVIAGNTRLKAARELKLEKAPVVRFDGPDIEAVAYAVADNKTHEFSAWDEPALVKILQELRAEDALDGVGYSPEDIDSLIAELERDIEQDVDDPGAEEPPGNPVSMIGDLWILGQHRLLCGDSTNAEDVARLMNGETASLLATDPPYLVDYQGGNHPQSWANRPETRDKHWDDYKDPDTGREFFESFLRNALSHCVERVPVYQWHAHRRQMLVEEAWRNCGLLVHQQVIWVKARAVLTRSHMMWQHEPCFYGWPEGKMPSKDRRPDPNATTVWNVDQIGSQDGIHPTQKPVELFTRPISWHTLQNEICLEPFSGSGSSVIAAEMKRRRCFALELSPAYVDVAVKRWQTATGQEATLDGTGQSFEDAAKERGVELEGAK